MLAVEKRSWTVFGRGQREDLDDEEAEELAGRMRVAVGREVEREGDEGVGILLGGGGEGGRSKL